MSWQKRPNTAARGRPLSVLAAENAASRNTTLESPTHHRSESREEPDRQDIARTLSLKDPAWFRQTSDRDSSLPVSTFSMEEESRNLTDGQPRQLLGLVSEETTEKQSSTIPGFSKAQPRSETTSPIKNVNTTVDMNSSQRKGSENILSSNSNTAEISNTPSSSLLGRTTMSERPVSPTKGAGGFVQSAMMKRTDSVSKRWSGQASGISRQDSTSSLPQTGPGSSTYLPYYSTTSQAHPTSIQSGDETDTAYKHHGSLHSRSKSVATLRTGQGSIVSAAPTFSPPLSPSKRWSPTKSTWLESALSRPESPTKQQTSSNTPTQPVWMTELSKAKKQREDAEAESAQATPNVIDPRLSPVIGFPSPSPAMPSPMPTKGPIIGLGLSGSETPSAASRRPILLEKASTDFFSVRNSGLGSVDSPAKIGVGNDSSAKTTPELYQASPAAAARSPPQQTPSSSGKIDFRAALKPRDSSGDQKPGGNLEFRSALGSLRKTTTQNYVAPDVLKNNILRGKAGLNHTDGPRKSERRDELKDSILQKKAEMKANPSSLEAGDHAAQKPAQAAAIPEAFRAREELNKLDGSSTQVTTSDTALPEALARQKTLRGGALDTSEGNLPKTFGTLVYPVLQACNDDNSDDMHVNSQVSKSSQDIIPVTNGGGHSRALPVVKSKSSNLANRFNPALAGLLAKGPSTRHTAGQSSVDVVKATEVSETQHDKQESNELNHMTKARVRGPKRRKPGHESTDGAPTSEVALKTKEAELAPPSLVTLSANPQVQPPQLPETISKTSFKTGIKLPGLVKTNVLSTSPSQRVKDVNPLTLSERKEQSPKKSIAISPLPINGSSNQADVQSSDLASTDNDFGKSIKGVKPLGVPIKPAPPKPHLSSPQKQTSKVVNLAEAKPQTTKDMSELPQTPAKPPTKSSRVVSDDLSKANQEQTRSSNVTGSDRQATVSGSGIANRLLTFFGDIPRLTTTPELDPQPFIEPIPSKSVVSTTKRSVQMVGDNGKLTVLSSEVENTLFSGSIYIITHVCGNGSGQRQAEVYLWSGNDVGSAAIEDAQIFAKKVARDASLNARTTPVVEIIRQGCESAGFMQAIGGILITRRGSHVDNTPDTFMLLGRPYLGHVVFDEVDVDVNGLHPCFVCLIVKPLTLQDKQMWLWKGKHCSKSTLGSARLICMNLASGGDVLEMDDGKESTAFFFNFPVQISSKRIDRTLTGKLSDKLSLQLFRIEIMPPRRTSGIFNFFSKNTSSPGRPSIDRKDSSSSIDKLQNPDALTQVVSILPFGQKDFDPEHIYVLDCVDSILVIPGPLLYKAQSNPVSSRTSSTASPGKNLSHHKQGRQMWEYLLSQACLFANDYAVLSAAIQDRDSVPVVKLLLDHVLPCDIQVMFRFWDSRRGLWGTAGLMAGNNIMVKDDGKQDGEKEDGLVSVAEVLRLCC